MTEREKAIVERLGASRLVTEIDKRHEEHQRRIRMLVPIMKQVILAVAKREGVDPEGAASAIIAAVYRAGRELF